MTLDGATARWQRFTLSLAFRCNTMQRIKMSRFFRPVAVAEALALADAGVSTDRLEIVGYGETQPVADNGTVEGRQANRRVEVAIYATEETVQSIEQGDGR